MTKSFNKKQIGLAVACVLALGIVSGAANAQSNNDRAYLDDSSGAVVKNPFGLCWNTSFGPPPAPSAECDPNYVAFVAPPAAKPVPAAPPMKVVALTPPAPRPVAEKLTLNADTLFDFDKSTLRPAGRDALDTFVGKLKDISPETIITMGHADRIGSVGYNQRLSERRVASVKAYLVSKGVEAGRI